MRSFVSLLLIFVCIKSYCQDVLFLKNGEEVPVKVLLVSSKEVSYKKYGNIEGPTFIMNKADIHFIKYQNGAKDIFQTIENPIPITNTVTSISGMNRSFLSIKNPMNNAIFFEIGGNGLIISTNYERKIRLDKENPNNFLAVKVGLGPYIAANTMNFTSSYNWGDGKNYFEAGGGIGYAFLVISTVQSYAYFTPTIGYRRMSPGGFLFRVYLTSLTWQNQYSTYNSNGYTTGVAYSYNYYPYFGISLGHSFGWSRKQMMEKFRD